MVYSQQYHKRQAEKKQAQVEIKEVQVRTLDQKSRHQAKVPSSVVAKLEKEKRKHIMLKGIMITHNHESTSTELSVKTCLEVLNEITLELLNNQE